MGIEDEKTRPVKAVKRSITAAATRKVKAVKRRPAPVAPKESFSELLALTQADVLRRAGLVNRSGNEDEGWVFREPSDKTDVVRFAGSDETISSTSPVCSRRSLFWSACTPRLVFASKKPSGVPLKRPAALRCASTVFTAPPRSPATSGPSSVAGARASCERGLQPWGERGGCRWSCPVVVAHGETDTAGAVRLTNLISAIASEAFSLISFDLSSTVTFMGQPRSRRVTLLPSAQASVSRKTPSL